MITQSRNDRQSAAAEAVGLGGLVLNRRPAHSRGGSDWFRPLERWERSAHEKSDTISNSDAEPPLDPDAAANTVVIALPSDASAAAIARQFVEDNRDHIRPDLIEDAQLLVSEVVANAVLHGRPQITLLVRVDRPSIGVAVADAGDDLPAKVQGAPPPSQPSGRGLMIVDALASAWGVIPNPEPSPGKTVWFELHPQSTGGKDST